MKLEPVKSSIVSKVGYDEVNSALHVEFPSGKIYVYEGVTPEKHAAFIGAESIGKHIIANIRGQFKHRMLEPEASE